MGRKTLKPPPAAPNAEDFDDDEDFGTSPVTDDDDLWDAEEAEGLDRDNTAESNDQADVDEQVDGDEHVSDPGEGSGDLSDGDDEPFDAPDVEPEPEVAVRDVLSAIAVRMLSAKMRARPLSAQSNQWILSTMGRLYDEYVDGVVDGEPVAKDLAVLFVAAGVREIVGQLNDVTREGIRHLIVDHGGVVAPIAAAVPESQPAPTASDERVIELAVGDVVPDRNQARDEGADAEIGDELHPDTVLPPIEVRPHPYAGQFALERNGTPTTHPPYMIVDGERRWRGSIAAGRTHIRAIVNVRPMDDGDLLLRQAALNTGKRLKPLEEARAWKRILDAKGWNVQQLAEHLKKPPTTVSDRVAILEAPKPFRKLFEDGVLSPSAAPLLRPLADLDDATALEVLNAAADTMAWDDCMRDGRTIPLDDVEHGLVRALGEVFVPLTDSTMKKRYTGQRVTLKKHVFAVDGEEIDQLLAAIAAEDKAREKQRATGGTPLATPAKVDPAIDRYKAQRAKEEKARKAKAALRLAQFRAISAKLPKTFDRPWLLFVVRGLIGEMTQDGCRLAVRALGLRESKSTGGGLNFDRDLLAHADTLQGASLLHLAVQCILAHELQVNPNYDAGTKRLGEAARLTGINLTKVKVPDPSGAKPAPAAKATPSKKKVEKRGGGQR